MATVIDICLVFINCNDTIGQAVQQATIQTTGSLFLTFLVVLFFLMGVGMLFGIKLEYQSIILLPLLLAYMAYYSEFIGIGSVILIYLSIIFTKNFIIK